MTAVTQVKKVKMTANCYVYSTYNTIQ